MSKNMAQIVHSQSDVKSTVILNSPHDVSHAINHCEVIASVQ